jgi:hypothetical protein
MGSNVFSLAKDSGPPQRCVRDVIAGESLSRCLGCLCFACDLVTWSDVSVPHRNYSDEKKPCEMANSPPLCSCEMSMPRARRSLAT